MRRQTRCPKCGGHRWYLAAIGMHVCRRCGHQVDNGKKMVA